MKQILFKKYFINRILSGRKIQTRRYKTNLKVGDIVNCKINYYAKPFCKIKILNTRQESLKDISKEDIKKEGFDSISDFLCCWTVINKAFNFADNVFVIDFELIKDESNGYLGDE